MVTCFSLLGRSGAPVVPQSWPHLLWHKPHSWPTIASELCLGKAAESWSIGAIHRGTRLWLGKHTHNKVGIEGQLHRVCKQPAEGTPRPTLTELYLKPRTPE